MLFTECQLALLKNEIDYKKKIQWRLTDYTKRCEERLKAAISFLDYIHVKEFIEKIINVYKSNILDIHKRKFVKWGGVYNPSIVNPENCIFLFF